MEIAGYRARVEPTEINAAGKPPVMVELCTVASPEELVDRAALLSARRVPEPPYWTLVWTGARALARALLETPPPSSARILDLGCGLGLCGLVAARSGAHTVFADKIPECLDFVSASAARASIDNYETRVLDFTCDSLDRRFDLILAADIVYEPADYEPLVSFLDRHLNDNGSIWLTETLRADAKLMLASLAARGFSDQCEASWVLEEGRRERTWLHRLRRPQSSLDARGLKTSTRSGPLRRV